jgi:ribosome-binding factor A
MDPHRTERISEALREELEELIGYELADPRINEIYVTEVQIGPDLRHAHVRLSMPPDEAQRRDALAALEHARNFIKRELAHRLELRRLPELHFEPDLSATAAGRMDALLKRMKKGRARE